MAPREESVKPSTAASEAAELVGAKAGPAPPAMSEAQTVHPIQREQIATQPEVKSPKGAAVVAQHEEPVKPSTAASEAAELTGAKGGPAPATKNDVQSARLAQREQIAAELVKEAAPSPKGAAVVAQREAAVSPEPAKPSSAASETTGLAGAKSGPPAPARSDAQSSEEIASQRELKSAFAAPAGADAAPAKGEALAAQEGERFVARGEDSLAAGNVAVAREFFLRAADAGVARGALLLASTYDPYELVGLHVVGVQPNTALAQRWYQRAEALGEKVASERIARLERR